MAKYSGSAVLAAENASVLARPAELSTQRLASRQQIYAHWHQLGGPQVAINAAIGGYITISEILPPYQGTIILKQWYPRQ